MCAASVEFSAHLASVVSSDGNPAAFLAVSRETWVEFEVASARVQVAFEVVSPA